MNHPPRILGLLVAMSCAASCFAATTPGPQPLKVFILVGQSNMEGQAVADLDGKDYNDGRGTLSFLLRDPEKAPRLQHLRDDQGHWTVRNDVWVRYKPENGPVKTGPLTLGFTVYDAQHHFGPELQFGHVLGDYFDNPVLLIKTAWGGKSLYRDFRPPSSGGTVGPYYSKMLTDIAEALSNLKTDFPSYSGAYELAGCVWYQGWNDGCEPNTAVPEYEQNLVNFIHDLRKDLNAPQLPFVIGELTGPWVDAPDEWAALRKAQAAAAARPEFQGTVLFVETHDFVRKPEDSPNPGHGHHEFGNAETYFLVGDALGQGMIKLLDAKPQAPPHAAPETHEAPAELEALRAELLRRMDIDQDARNTMIKWMGEQGTNGFVSVANLTAEQRAEFEKVMTAVSTIDEDNTKWLSTVIEQHGWPTFKLAGKDGANAAWLLVQHADADVKFQRRCLDMMTQLAKEEVSQSNVAYLTDRVLLAEGKNQIYGTQFTFVDGALKPRPIEDEANVDARRKEIGLPPLAEYAKLIEQQYGGAKK